MGIEAFALFGLPLFQGGGIKEGVLLGFWWGNKMKDEDNYLTQGTNKQVFYKIYKSDDEIDEEAISKLLKEAVRIDLLYKQKKKTN